MDIRSIELKINFLVSFWNLNQNLISIQHAVEPWCSSEASPGQGKILTQPRYLPSGSEHLLHFLRQEGDQHLLKHFPRDQIKNFQLTFNQPNLIVILSESLSTKVGFTLIWWLLKCGLQTHAINMGAQQKCRFWGPIRTNWERSFGVRLFPGCSLRSSSVVSDS